MTGPQAAERGWLAFDFGTRRIGVAVGNSVLRQAQALKTLSLTGDARWQAIAALIAEWHPDELVVGVPRHPDGNEHEVTAQARRFARQLHGRFHLPVHEVDERYSSVEAQTGGARAAAIDAAAAAIILQQHMDGLAPNGDS